jgi:hypothetical protein
MEHETFWWIALGGGLVVILVAVALLEIFTRLVARIEDASERIWHTGKQVAANTATTWQLDGTAARLEALTEEAGRHAELLRRGRP